MTIRDKINALSQEQKKIEDANKVTGKEIFYGLGTVACLLVGLFSITQTPLLTVSYLALSAAAFSGMRKNTNVRTSKIDAIKGEKAKLVNLTKTGLDTSEASQKTRKDKMNKLDIIKKKRNETANKLKDKEIRRRWLVIGSFLLSGVFPGPLTLAVPALAAYKVYRDHQYVTNVRRVDEIDRDKDYLDIEYKLADKNIKHKQALQAQRQARGAQQQAVRQRNMQVAQQGIQQMNQKNQTTSSPAKERTQNEILIDNYIKMLEQQPTKTKGKVLTKTK